MRAGKRVRVVCGEVLRHWEPGAGVAVRGVARNGPAIGLHDSAIERRGVTVPDKAREQVNHNELHGMYMYMYHRCQKRSMEPLASWQ